MPDNKKNSNSIDITDLQTEFYNLRIGEEINRLNIKEIRKVFNPKQENNLPGVDYKYYIISDEDKVLSVNSWVLWKKIAEVLRKEKTIQCTISIKHIAHNEYIVNSL